MTRKNRILTLAATVALMAATSLVATDAAARERGGRFAGGGGGPGARLETMARHLELTEDQTSAVAEIHEKGQARDMKLRKDLARLRNEMKGELLKDDPAEKSVLGLTRKIGDLRTQLRENRVRDRLAVRKLLTSEQRDRMLTMRGRRGGGGHHGRGCDGDGCGQGHRGAGRGRGPRGEGRRSPSTDR